MTIVRRWGFFVGLKPEMLGDIGQVPDAHGLIMPVSQINSVTLGR